MKKQEILRKIKLFLFDMDGTLYIGDRLFDFTPRLLDTIKRNGGRYMFLTNNSSKSVNDYIKKLGGMGIKADCDDFLTSSQATAYLLRRDYPGKTLYVCGTRSLEEELEKEGDTLIIRPSETIEISRLEKKPEMIEAMYELGVYDAKEKLQQVKKFLRESKEESRDYTHGQAQQQTAVTQQTR